ncbi:hypothetical protein [Nocardiopsis halotolerans]|uniref:hypothetical protein n=1 Tax=Nocardiopsis halotolerans TaxID=124252 RepID=UPI0005941E44|nr:hypothetical protein [Nocardiopsis halotolerans]
MTRRRWRTRELAETMDLIGAETDRAWVQACAEWDAEPGGDREHDLAELVLSDPGQFPWRVVDAAMDRLACPECGRALGSGDLGCGPCDLADGHRYLAREPDRPAVPPGNEHAIRVGSVVVRQWYRYPPRVVCGWELGLPDIHRGLLPTGAQARAARARINRLTEQQVRTVASHEELEALTGGA